MGQKFPRRLLCLRIKTRCLGNAPMTGLSMCSQGWELGELTVRANKYLFPTEAGRGFMFVLQELRVLPGVWLLSLPGGSPSQLSRNIVFLNKNEKAYRRTFSGPRTSNY